MRGYPAVVGIPTIGFTSIVEFAVIGSDHVDWTMILEAVGTFLAVWPHARCRLSSNANSITHSEESVSIDQVIRSSSLKNLLDSLLNLLTNLDCRAHDFMTAKYCQ